MKEIKLMSRSEMFEKVYKNLRTKGYCYVTMYHGEGIGRHGDPMSIRTGEGEKAVL